MTKMAVAAILSKNISLLVTNGSMKSETSADDEYIVIEKMTRDQNAIFSTFLKIYFWC